MSGRRMSHVQQAETLARLNARPLAGCPLCSKRLDGLGVVLHVECAIRADRCPRCGRGISACACPLDGAA